MLLLSLATSYVNGQVVERWALSARSVTAGPDNDSDIFVGRGDLGNLPSGADKA
jgi:hypothetical protein